MALQLQESGSQSTVVEPVTNFLTRRKVIINGKAVAISAALAGQTDEHADETLVRGSQEDQVDEESALLSNSDGLDPRRHFHGTNRIGKVDSTAIGTHSGHHHYDPLPVDGSECPGVSDITLKSQLLAVAIMEGGLCFHSIFVGLTLAVATGGGFVSLFIAIMFHRMISHPKPRIDMIETFEGMGLGARIATLPFPRKSIRPYLMGLTFAVVTPIGMAIGLSIRTLYSPTSVASLITTGVFDSISSGLLIYASLVELLAHEFLMGEMRFEGVEKAILAGACIVVGAAAMSLLGLWV
jgi:zinc transporter 1/2/3